MKRINELKDKLNGHMDYFSKCAFDEGFDAATKELMRVIEIQRESLDVFVGIVNNEFGDVEDVYPLFLENIAKADAILNGDSNETT